MKNKSFIGLLCFTLVVIGTSCKKETSKPPDLLSKKLDNIFSDASLNPNLRCLIVYKTDHTVKEKYYHPGDSSAPHDVRSVTKSVMSTLIGIAIDKGIITSENQKIGSYLRPNFSTIDSARSNIKISDVLSMSSGLSVDGLADPVEYNKWIAAPDQISYTLNKPMINTPGHYFIYNSGAAHLTSAILSQASGVTTKEFASQNLFIPLGIDNPHWEIFSGGLFNGAAGLSLTPSDMLKIGKLYLNDGVFNGTPVVSKEWITKATSFKISTHDMMSFGPDYGYFWWLGNTRDHNYFFANGYGGQYIVVVPDMELIVIATNNWTGVTIATANAQWCSTLSMIIEKIIPAFIGTE